MLSRKGFLEILDLHNKDSAAEQVFVAYSKELQRIVDQVDDVLIVNWVGPRVDGDYKKALYALRENAVNEALYFATQENAYFYAK